MTTTETETPEVEPETPALESGEPPPTPFWQRPNVDRYLVPLLLPVVMIVGLAMFVINMSRVFLAGHGETAVIVGSVLTAGIMIGAALLSAAPKLKSSSLTLVTVGFVLAIGLSGWLSLGSAEPHEEGGTLLPAEGPALGQVDFGTDGLRFVPDSADAETGVWTIHLTSGSGTHTLAFVDPAVNFETIEVAANGDEAASRAFFGSAADYEFYCTVPGHREAGMEGIVTVTGATKTLAEAEAEAAAGGEGSGAPVGEEAPAVDEGGPAGGGAEE
jgi:plastocyanin